MDACLGQGFVLILVSPARFFRLKPGRVVLYFVSHRTASREFQHRTCKRVMPAEAIM